MSQPVKDRATLNQTSDREVRIERIFDAPRERVWRAHTEPELVAQWWGRGNDVVVERHELRPGGHWRFVERADGAQHGFEGRFREVTPQDRLSYTFEWDGAPGHVIVETTEFEDLGGTRTRLVTTALFTTSEDLEGMVSSGMEQGLNESYAALDRLLESLD